MKKYKIDDFCQILDVEINTISEFIASEWLVVASPETNEFDQEDLTRARLVLDLLENFGVNKEAVPIILHLVDQLNQSHYNMEART